VSFNASVFLVLGSHASILIAVNQKVKNLPGRVRIDEKLA